MDTPTNQNNNVLKPNEPIKPTTSTPVEPQKPIQVAMPTPPLPPKPEPPKLPPTPTNPLENLPKSPLPNMTLPPAPASPPPPSSPPAEMKRSPFRFLIPVLGIVLVGLIAAFAVSRLLGSRDAGDQPDSGTAGSGATITYWGLWEPPAIMEEVISQFEAANPGITVEYQQQSIQDYRERLQNALNDDSGPDVFRFHVTWRPLLSDVLEAVPASVLTETDFENQQYQVVKDWLRSGNDYVGIPLMYEGLGLYYNRQVFEAAGKTPPKTWEELRRTALELTVKNKEGVIQRSGVALGTTSNVDNWSDILGVMLLQNGANPANPTNQLGQDALTFYTLFNTADKVWDDSMPTSTIAFATEKTAMMIAPSWRAHEVRAMNPNLSFAVAELPQLPDTQVGWASIWADGVAAKSNRATKEASWKFLSYLNQKETLRSWYALASKQRLFGEIFARKDMADQLSTDPFVGAYIKQAPYAESWYLSSRTFDNGPNDKIIKYYEDAVNAVLRGESADQALSTTQEGVSQIINQYRLPKN
jgi:multiple sugar transport system substrate-binding protein